MLRTLLASGRVQDLWLARTTQWPLNPGGAGHTVGGRPPTALWGSKVPPACPFLEWALPHAGRLQTPLRDLDSRQAPHRLGAPPLGQVPWLGPVSESVLLTGAPASGHGEEQEGDTGEVSVADTSCPQSGGCSISRGRRPSTLVLARWMPGADLFSAANRHRSRQGVPGSPRCTC